MLNILVTGASRGIGREIAKELTTSARVLVAGRDEDALKLLNLEYFVGDLTNNSDLERLGKFIQDNKIDVLINNAGEYIYRNIEKISLEEVEHLYSLNLKAPTILISKAVPYMKSKKWGRIINIGSISGVMGEAYASLYSASKAGLIGLTKALALELAEYNITVNTINPGWVETELGKDSINKSEFSEDEILSCIPQKRYVEPKEISGLCKYLISDDAKGITGQGINLCAGLSVGI